MSTIVDQDSDEETGEPAFDVRYDDGDEEDYTPAEVDNRRMASSSSPTPNDASPALAAAYASD